MFNSKFEAFPTERELPKLLTRLKFSLRLKAWNDQPGHVRAITDLRRCLINYPYRYFHGEW